MNPTWTSSDLAEYYSVAEHPILHRDDARKALKRSSLPHSESKVIAMVIAI